MKSTVSSWIVTALTLGSALAAVTAHAAEPASRPDTLVVQGPAVEVTALRGRDRISEIPAAAFVVSREDVRRAGSPRLATLLQTIPGLFAYGQTSSGDATIVDPRGFTASGESSYLKLLVDGQDVRDLENGNVDWDWVAPGAIQRVEVVQGPGAWIYGDASEGGIVNVVRAAPSAAGLGTSIDARAGSFGLRSGNLGLSGPAGDAQLQANGFGRQVDGWRDHSRERVYGGSGEASMRWGGRELAVEGAGLDANRQDPGALTADAWAADPEQADTPTDFTHSKRGRMDVRLQSAPGPEPAWALTPYGRVEDVDQVRTLFFQPQFHHTRGWTGGATLDGRSHATLGDHAVGLFGEAAFEQSNLRSKYDDYSTGARGPELASGESWRSLAWATASARAELDARTILRLSVRGDLARVHSKDELAGTSTSTRHLDSFTPLLGLSRMVGANGNVYASASTAFRVPTLFQMFDRRPFFVAPPPVPPVTISNSQLDPQRAVSFEGGARWDRADGAAAQLALYWTQVRNEIDFDINTLSYANISKSRHRGIEALVAWPLPGAMTARVGGAVTPTTFDGGDHDGSQINGVPLGTGTAALTWAPIPVASADVAARYIGRQFLDKDETHPLGDVVAWDAGVETSFGRVHAGLRVLNIFDKRYADSGFIGAFGEERLLPAAPRSANVTLSWE